jgi:cation diffusion facilitator family transporter
MSAAAETPSSIFFALGANLAIALAKTAGAVFTASSSMLAEAIHSWADCTNQLLLLWGMREARRAPDAEHPLGYGRAIYFWSFIVALMLFSLGGMFSVYEGWHKWQHPRALEHADWAAGILLFAVAAESFSLAGGLRDIRTERGEQSLWRWFRQSRRSELIVVLGEDVAALGGLALALVFVTLTLVTGNPLWDAVGSMVIGALLIAVAWLVGMEVKALLMGQSAHPDAVQAMHRHLREQPEVAEVFNLITQQLGDRIMVSVKARMQPTGSEAGLIEAINRVEARFRAAFPAVGWMFFEPDLRD